MTTTPLVSIGIPTFNRAHLVGEAILAATSQTYPQIEITVSDNASSDSTSEVVSGINNERVVYHRHDTNIGASRNWASLLERATGEYFVWLQDDDLIFPSFVADAVRALEKHPEASVYMGYAAVTQDPQFMFKPWLYGPPVRMNWVTSEFELFDGDFLTPISLFLSFAIPPVIVYRTSVLRECFGDFLNDRYALFGERVGIARLGIGRSVIIAPQVCGIFRDHAAQHSKAMLKSLRIEQEHRRAAAERLSELWGDRNLKECAHYCHFLEGIPKKSIIRYFDEVQPWCEFSPLCRQVSESLRQEWLRRGYAKLTVAKFPTMTRRMLRECKAITSNWRKHRR